MSDETYKHAWNQGLLSGIHFACQELGLSPEVIKAIERRWIEEINSPLKNKTPMKGKK